LGLATKIDGEKEKKTKAMAPSKKELMQKVA
jgi:hypothetical protein